MLNIQRLQKYLAHQFIWVNLLAFILPFSHKMAPMFIAVFALIVLIQARFRAFKIQIDTKVWLFALLYLAFAFSGFWTSNTHELKPELETKLSLFLFPILFLFTKPLPKAVLNKVLLNFVLGCALNLIASIFKGYDCFVNQGIVECFYYFRVAYGFHPSYSALYFNLAVAILLYFDIHKLSPYHLKRWMIWVFITLFSIFLVMLSSKMGLIGLFIVLITFLVYYIKVFGWKRTIYKGGTPAIIFFIAIIATPFTQNRLKVMSNVVQNESNVQEQYVERVESSSFRIMAWQIAWEVVKENPLLGVGVGDVTEVLVEKYKANNMTEAATLRLNSHNQFIETYLATGIIGFLILIGYFLIGTYLSLTRKSFIYLIFIAVSGAHFCVESMLETQAGVVFFAFFNSLLFVQLNHKQNS